MSWEGFDWDHGNLINTLKKYSVLASECEQGFFNSPLVAGLDERHSNHEPRYYALGVTDAKRRLFVVFTVRKRLVIVISARNMSKKEREVFDKS